MASMREIRRRIKSVKSTAQVTKAMRMVAAAKMRRSQQAALNGRPYSLLLHNMIVSIYAQLGNDTGSSPLCASRPIRNEAVILVTTDKGLCGGLNTNLIREASRFDPATTLFLAAGRKGAQFVQRTKRQLVGEFSFHDTPQYSEARSIVKLATELFLEGKIDKVSVVFPRFKNTMSQIPTVHPILPLTELKPLDNKEYSVSDDEDPHALRSDILFEPSAKVLYDALLPHYLNTVIYHVLLEAKACEFSARMVAMKNATDNANTLIKELTIHYNKLRQTGITNQLLEIASATSSLS
jgi:F-type H+-transporting ATPase subunit gamma